MFNVAEVQPGDVFYQVQEHDFLWECTANGKTGYNGNVGVVKKDLLGRYGSHADWMMPHNQEDCYVALQEAQAVLKKNIEMHENRI